MTLMFALAFQLSCHDGGLAVAEGARMTPNKLIRAIVFALCISASAIAQTESDRSLRARARSLEPLIAESAKRYGIDPRILWTLCFVESRFKTDAVSPKGARGPMQFMPDTAVRYGLNNPHDPKAAIGAGARYLRDLLNRFGGRVDLALAAYNSGEGAVESFLTGRPLLLRTGKIINPRGLVTGGIPPYPETRNYVGSILKLANSVSASSPLISAPTSRRNSSTQNISDEGKKKSITSSSFIDLDQ
jgi:soluble lytic murein transglycosylase-like protein